MSKTLKKTISWRIIATTSSITIGYLITGSIEIGFSIGILEVIVKSILYFIHEKYWDKKIIKN